MKVLFTSELAEALGVKANRIVVWRKRFDDCPQPIHAHERQLLWSSKSVTEWKKFMAKHGFSSDHLDTTS